jgi:hypothetical protein
MPEQFVGPVNQIHLHAAHAYTIPLGSPREATEAGSGVALTPFDSSGSGSAPSCVGPANRVGLFEDRSLRKVGYIILDVLDRRQAGAPIRFAPLAPLTRPLPQNPLAEAPH